jgi:hypothetical protein
MPVTLRSLFLLPGLWLGLSLLVWAEPVAVVIHPGKQAHCLRNFERRILSSGVVIESKDVIDVDEGIFEFEMSGARWTLAPGTRIRLRNEDAIAVVELISGQCHVIQATEEAWKLETPQVHLKAGRAELWLALDESGLEVAQLQGDTFFSTDVDHKKFKPMGSPQRYRLSLGRSLPLAQKNLSPMEVLVFREMLSSKDTPQQGEVQNLEGENYLPTQEILQGEVQRRAVVAQELKNKEEHLQHLKEQLNTLRADEFKDFQEVLRKEEVYSFPTPFAPPPK